MTECIFCEIRDNEKPSVKIFEDEKTMAILDIFPVARGHILIIPKAHSDNLYDIADEDVSAIGITVARMAKTVKKVLKCDGVNVYQGNEAAAMQEIMHTHFHVIPRFFSDNIIFGAPRDALVRDEAMISELRNAASE
ncbi:MAG: HIT family protein [Candidatus Hodarchaeales archaeon]